MDKLGKWSRPYFLGDLVLLVDVKGTEIPIRGWDEWGNWLSSHVLLVHQGLGRAVCEVLWLVLWAGINLGGRAEIQIWSYGCLTLWWEWCTFHELHSIFPRLFHELGRSSFLSFVEVHVDPFWLLWRPIVYVVIFHVHRVIFDTRRIPAIGRYLLWLIIHFNRNNFNFSY